MFVLIVAGIIGFAIGRAISLVVSQLFQQHVSLNVPNARTLIVLGSGGKKVYFAFETSAVFPTKLQNYLEIVLFFRNELPGVLIQRRPKNNFMKFSRPLITHH
jgi:hypothetical protein